MKRIYSSSAPSGLDVLVCFQLWVAPTIIQVEPLRGLVCQNRKCHLKSPNLCWFYFLYFNFEDNALGL